MKAFLKKKIIVIVLCFCLFAGNKGVSIVYGEEETSNQNELIQAPSGILMEASTGTILFEKDADTRRSPASITKIMTLILIFDALEAGRLKLEDLVTTSAYAKSMGGSQVFLEEGEQQDVKTMIKCIVIASGNDASVAMAEHLSGSEGEFVKQMNARARGLGMKNTHFEDCCGLTESEEHYTTARDIAIMSRELITKHPEILEYSSIWMDTIIHSTRQGTKEFGLTNTNKLVRSYDGCVGLKTGSTSNAKYCLSAVAKRKDITLIAVVMAAPDYKARFRDAAAMLNAGFSGCSLYVDKHPLELPSLSVKHGVKKTVVLKQKEPFRLLTTDGSAIGKVKRKLKLRDQVSAPVKKDDIAGEILYYSGKVKIGKVPVLFAHSVRKAGYGDCIRMILGKIF